MEWVNKPVVNLADDSEQTFSVCWIDICDLCVVKFCWTYNY